MPSKPKLFTSTLTDRTWHMSYGMDDVTMDDVTTMRDVGHVSHGSGPCDPGDLDIAVHGARGNTVKNKPKGEPVTRQKRPTKWMPCLLVSTLLLVTLGLLVSAAIVVTIRQDANDITQLRKDVARLIETQNTSDSQGQDILVTLKSMALIFTEVKEDIITPTCTDAATSNTVDKILLNMDAFFKTTNAILEEIDEKQNTLTETTNQLNNSIEQVDVVLNSMVTSVKESIKDDLKLLNHSFSEMANKVNMLQVSINGFNDSLSTNSHVQLKTASMLEQINASLANVSRSQLEFTNVLEHMNATVSNLVLTQDMTTSVLGYINATLTDASLSQLSTMDVLGNMNTSMQDVYLSQLKAANVLEVINANVQDVSLAQVNTVNALGNINASIADVSLAQLMTTSVLVNINTTVQDVSLQQSTTNALLNTTQSSVNDVLGTVDDIMTLTNQSECSEGRFKVVRTPRLSWSDAKLSCEAMGGYLAEMTDFVTLDYVRREVYPNETESNGLSINLWVGATDASREGVWLWDRSREPISVQNWEVAGPHAVTPTMDCMEMVQEGEWNDEECSRRNGYICERLTGDCEVWQ